MDGAEGAEKALLISRIEELEQRQMRLFARDRSLSLLATTLTVQQLKVLVLLALDGDMAAHELAEGVGVGVATLTGIVDRLVARGLVLRWEDPDDRRVRRVGLTDEGRRLVEELFGSGMRRYRPVLARLDPAVLAGIAQGMEALCGAIEEDAETREDTG